MSNELVAVRSAEPARYEGKLRAEQKRYRQLVNDGAAWRRELAEDVAQVRIRVQRQLDVDTDDVETEFRTAVAVIEKSGGDGDEVIRQLSASLVAAADRAERVITLFFEGMALVCCCHPPQPHRVRYLCHELDGALLC